MKKFYMTVLSMILTLPVSMSQEIIEHKINFQTPDINGVIGQLKSSGADITIKATDNTTDNITGIMTSCLDLSGTFPYIGLQTGGSIDIIINEGSLPIYSIQYVGRSSHDVTKSESASAVSPDGITFPTDYYLNNSGFPNSLTKSVFMSGDNQDVCSDSYIQEIPDLVYQGASRTEIQDFRKTVKAVRLIWGLSSYGGRNLTPGASPDFFGLVIKTITDTPTIIEESPDANNLTITRNFNGSYRLSRKSDVTVYDLSGRLVFSSRRTEELTFDNYNKGVYLIKAVSVEGDGSVQMKLSL